MTLRCAGSKRIYIFGGFDGNKWLNDLHVLDVGRLEAREWACARKSWKTSESFEVSKYPSNAWPANRSVVKGGKCKLKFASEERKDGVYTVDFCSPSDRVESLVQEHHKVDLPFTSCDIFAWC